MASSTSQIILIVFIRTLFYLSYIIHAPNLKNGPRLAPIKKAAEFYIVRISENT